ncbi:glycosyltransferase involved in cell wall biosynthesis [Breznakia sp. PF5-3]|uniref:glycosyltransferase family 2 protein n=1 Tax=unclassified Breznakia TaxID=2623764 RepID=UPI002404DF3A|nr:MULTISPECIES: glycosyltransferase family 2 protein [unclassified Breznakia]MDF9824977.1 glycosyltransferase involved in cell wall biosynthesis [Breznakia sp. PM6-1]MDF9835830.1 glycosyltransferase involved in cell wall biosynthesis [Breznakia sp. PF5-3]MDF9836918.1 glycosyltransferase involved in cell wall biosynthesis [Breznakia sp. PFB2-8]MDF9859864.1 glycosyltransferase involved in cell wall biosynthesis [Breznakia sp. PH5-24]
MKENLKTLVIVPAYNEALNIEKVIHDLKTKVPQYDFIVINDGSKDNTLEILEKCGCNYIDGFANLGLFGAVQTGFKYAMEHGYDVAIQFDGDGQHDADYLDNMVDEISKGNNIVIGSRFVTNKKSLSARMLGSRLLSLAIKLVTFNTIKDPTSGLRAYDKETIVDYATDMNNPPEPDTLVYMIRKKRKIKEVQVEMSDREFGESYLNLPNTVKYMSRMLISIFLIQPFRKVK